MRLFILVLLMISFVSAVNVDFDCPNSVKVNENFSCCLNVSEGEGVYDVKIYIRGDNGMINRIWADGDWQRTDWYAKNLIENGEDIDVKLKIDKEFYGVANGTFKLRENETKKIVFSENFFIEIIQDDVVEEENTEEENNSEKANDSEVEEVEEEFEIIEEEAEEIILSASNSVKEEEVKVISLNSESEELIYISKNAKVVDYLSYAFIVFLIFIIGILVWDKRD